MTNQRAFIDKKNEERECLSCYKILPFSEFSRRDSMGVRSLCKDCRADAEWQRILGERFEAGDPTVKECPNCDRFMLATCRCQKEGNQQ